MTKSESIIPLLRRLAFSELAFQFADYIERQDLTNDKLIPITAALLTETVANGEIALNLAEIGEQGNALDEIFPETAEQWLSRLQKSHLFGSPGETTPFILTKQGQVYLFRYWQDEQIVHQLIKQKCQFSPVKDRSLLKQSFADWPTQHETDWQHVAVLMAILRQFCVISGGPGTGKTTIVLQLLKALAQQDDSLTVALAAPTGKAAVRLQHAVTSNSQFNLEATTLHRLLAITADNEKGRYSAARPLAVDVLIVDEASMIDISLMATLMKSLSPSTKLVLLGDSDQLSSVESGAVLANLCRQGMAFSTEFEQLAKDVLGLDLPVSDKTDVDMLDSLVTLSHSYRFAGDSELGQLADAVKQGDEQGVIAHLSVATELTWLAKFEQTALLEQMNTTFHEFFTAVQTRQSARTCLESFEQGRILCALKNGPESVDSVNTLIERQLARQGWRTQQRFYHGRPIMVTQNDYRQRLFNGDTGLILYNEHGVLSACFLFADEVRWLSLNRLPAHETAYAMTIHKSQGSEYNRVCIVMPEQESPVLNRALLYTAVTRSKQRLSLIASEAIIRKTLSVQK